MCTTYWAYSTFLVFLLLSRFQGLDGRCLHEYFNGHERVRCEAINLEQLVHYYSTLDVENLSLKVVNSNLPHIESLPYRINDWSMSSVDLIIRSCGIRRIDPEAFESWSDLDHLDLSYNQISETKFLTAVKTVWFLNLSHNEFEYPYEKDFFHLENMISLDLSFNNIRNFSDINQRSLKHFYLSHNSLTNLANLLVNCTNLRSIDLSYNKLRYLSENDFPPTSYLEYLNVDHNELISIDIQTIIKFLAPRHHPSLLFIFSNNNLETINMSGNVSTDRNNALSFYFSSENLPTVDFSNNILSTLDFIPIFTHWGQLSSLNINRNKIKTLRGNFKELRTNILNLSDNDITYIVPNSLIGCYIYKNLDLSHNKIKYLNNTYFRDLKHLLSLNLSYNQIVEIGKTSFNGLSNLETLDLSHCFLRNLDTETFSNVKNLKSLNLSFNVLEKLPRGVFENMILTKLDLSHNSLAVLPDNIFSGFSTTTLNLEYNRFFRFSENIFNNSKISHLTLSGNMFKEINHNDFFGLTSLISLNLSYSGIKKLYHNSFSELNNLEMLYLDNNGIQTIPKQFLRVRKRIDLLSLAGNNITDLKPDGFSRRTKLTTLNISLKGKLSEGRFKNLNYLKELNIIRSELTYIENGSFYGLVLLKSLVFENSKPPIIEPGAFVGLRSLTKFDAQSWFRSLEIVKSYQFSGLEEVTRLDLSNFGIHTVENEAFFGMRNLKYLCMSDNIISSLHDKTFEGLEMLEKLNLSHNQLDYIQRGVFSNLKNLQNLHLDHNRLFSKIGIFSNLKQLKFLNLSHNNFNGHLGMQVLFPIRNLEVLDINANQISEFEFSSIKQYLPSLRKIGIGSNQWRCSYLPQMLLTFGGKYIDYTEISYLEFKHHNIDGIQCLNN